VFRRRSRGDADQPGPDDFAAEGEQDFSDEPEDPDEPEYLDEPDYPDEPEQPREPEAQAARPAGPRHALRPAESRVNLGDPDTWTRAQRGPAAPAGERASGPWDGAEAYPERERIDFGCILVPAVDGFDIQVNVAEEQGIWIAVVRGENVLQLQAFAAPKTSGLWDEVRQEIAEEVAKSGGGSEEAAGPFGAELHARVAAGQEGQRSRQLQPLRFLGVDGPRWFLRGMITGPAARRSELAVTFEEIFADVVVVRGDHPAPPREQLEIQLPEEARRALEEQMAQDGQGQELPNPFARGPEITETR
jgi:hypothetical protein